MLGLSPSWWIRGGIVFLSFFFLLLTLLFSCFSLPTSFHPSRFSLFFSAGWHEHIAFTETEWSCFMDKIEVEIAQTWPATEHPYGIIPIPSCATLKQTPSADWNSSQAAKQKSSGTKGRISLQPHV